MLPCIWFEGWAQQGSVEWICMWFLPSSNRRTRTLVPRHRRRPAYANSLAKRGSVPIRDETGRFIGVRPKTAAERLQRQTMGSGGIFKSAAVQVLRLERRLMSTGEPHPPCSSDRLVQTGLEVMLTGWSSQTACFWGQALLSCSVAACAHCDSSCSLSGLWVLTELSIFLLSVISYAMVQLQASEFCWYTAQCLPVSQQERVLQVTLQRSHCSVA